MSLLLFKKYSLSLQAIFWSFWFFIFIINCLAFELSEYPVLYALIRTTSLAVLVYVNYYVLLPQFFEKKQYWVYGTLLFLSMVLVAYFNYLLSPFLESQIIDNIRLLPIFFLFNSIMIGLTSLIRYVNKWLEDVEARANLKNEKLKAELNFLKAQINPHFLFNTLNNIYTLVYMKADNAVEMIEKLSDIMRYMLYDCKEDRVPLRKEVTLLENFIELQQLKQEKRQNICFQYDGVKSEHLIAPLILINFLENAFKYSDLGTNELAFVKVQLRVDESNNLKLSVENTMKEERVKKITNGGIGLSNSKKQLDHNYQNYELNIQPDGNIFKLNLMIQLEKKA